MARKLKQIDRPLSDNDLAYTFIVTERFHPITDDG